MLNEMKEMQEQLSKLNGESRYYTSMLVSAKVRSDIIKTHEPDVTETPVLGVMGTFVGMEILECDGMPDEEALSFKSKTQAREFLEYVKVLGYVRTKEVYMEIFNGN